MNAAIERVERSSRFLGKAVRVLLVFASQWKSASLQSEGHLGHGVCRSSCVADTEVLIENT